MSTNILQRITELNERAEVLNSQRQKTLGAVQVAQEMFENLAKEYKEKYGVEVTVKSIGAEYKRVKAEAEQKAEELEKQIAYIESGEYKKQVIQAANGQGVMTMDEAEPSMEEEINAVKQPSIPKPNMLNMGITIDGEDEEDLMPEDYSNLHNMMANAAQSIQGTRGTVFGS